MKDCPPQSETTQVARARACLPALQPSQTKHPCTRHDSRSTRAHIGIAAGSYQTVWHAKAKISSKTSTLWASKTNHRRLVPQQQQQPRRAPRPPKPIPNLHLPQRATMTTTRTFSATSRSNSLPNLPPPLRDQRRRGSARPAPAQRRASRRSIRLRRRTRARGRRRIS